MNGRAVGWFQGRLEFGPRALGGRSILGDTRSETMQRTLNPRVKYPESFRPFAPSVLREGVNKFFEIDDANPYMLPVAGVHQDLRRQMTEEEGQLSDIDKLNIKRSEIPAVTHVDCSVKIQTTHHNTNSKYHMIINSFKPKTGCFVIVNASFK